MKTVLIYVLLSVSAFQVVCSQELPVKKMELQINDVQETDSVEYEITIFDTGFGRWLNTQAKPIEYYSQGYLESWNYQYVTEWNIRFMTGLNSDIIGCMIDYEPNTNYGKEVNYQLYEYFRYVETELRLNLLSRAVR